MAGPGRRSPWGRACDRLLGVLVRFGADSLDAHLPLRNWERMLHFQRDWPTLDGLWGVLKACRRVW
jgi:hypothetical protein